jgi:DNA-binding NarL/FixJ family response regulator
MGGGMDFHRIFVIWDHPLFYESLRLLLQGVDIEWVGSAHSSEREYTRIHQLTPDIIFIEEKESGDIPFNVIDLMKTNSQHLRIFGLSLADNDLMIYHREKRTVLQADDLLNLIRESE